MTDTNKLKELAERATPGPWVVDAQQSGAIFNIESESGDQCVAMSQENPAPTRLEMNEQRRVNAAFIAAANPQAILKLIAEVERLRIGLKGDFDLDAWLEWTREKDRIKAQNDALQGALHAVQAEVDGNLRPLTRDLVNMVSGLNNGTHPNDIYDHCDEIERIIGAALEGATQ
ncbi:MULTISPECIES: ead/Ea22-like family protein [unclassified Pseudomonas]|uniref:ead/Ea22-like family protein n=1 Tax=unclassified Pseudomonas TaxID=196821 RepID=UPI002157F1CD|nr:MULTISPECIES: ead/Ea22-like family protein [unclassified Pseudomonas]